MAITIDGSQFTFPNSSTLTNAYPVLHSTVSLSGSGTTVTGIPAARIVWITFADAKTSGTDLFWLRVGSGGSIMTSANYHSSVTNSSTASAGSTLNAGASQIALNYNASNVATYLWRGTIQIQKYGTTNYYIVNCVGGTYTTGRSMFLGGYALLPGQLDSVQILPSGANTISGSMSVFWS